MNENSRVDPLYSKTCISLYSLLHEEGVDKKKIINSKHIR